MADSPQVPNSPINGNGHGAVKSSNSSTRVVDDVTSLTSFNPFSEEDEHDQSSYTLVSSLFTRVKNSFAAPLSNAVAAASGTPAPASAPPAPNTTPSDQDTKRTSDKVADKVNLSPAARPQNENRPRPMKFGSTLSPSLAPPLVTPLSVDSEVLEPREPPTYNIDFESPTAGGSLYSPMGEPLEGGLFGTAIPGFPIQDQSDARSIHTATSLRRSESVSKIIRRLRGDGLSRDYWMDDENAKECYLCKSVFTTWRRKHHCRICGQIYCSRCASNIIKGSRLGHEYPRSKHEGIRVCNLCMEEFQHNDDDDDDRRSVFSNLSTPFAYGPDGHSQSFLSSFHNPFLGSQIFGRADDPHPGLYSIAETRRHHSGSDGSGFFSRPMTPGGDDDGDNWYENGDELTAPFRRGVADEDKEVIVSVSFPSDQPTNLLRAHSRSKTPVEIQTGLPKAFNASQSTIQFPGSSPEHRHESESPHHESMRSRVNSYVGLDNPTPFLRSRVQSRLDESGTGEWRRRHVSNAYAHELNSSSLFHLRIMLRQLLTKEGIPNIREWEETLSKIALRMARDLTFTTYPSIEGDDMNVRQYVKIKKIPGGSPRDSEYVDGVVITKNVAHRQMARHLRNPRIMLVTFPLEFQRVEGQYMHFGQIVRQEKEYLHNLVSRIAALRPHVVLVENSVSRLALDALVHQSIAVARSVKSSAIDLVSRMTQGDIFSSMDKLAFESRLGHCGRFEIQTFDHPLIPSRRKTYMRFEGCGPNLGCTIILRGGDVEQLKRIKKVTLFVACIVRNLKLETHVWKDSLLSVPQLTTDSSPQAYIEISKNDEPYEDERSASEIDVSVPPSSASSSFTDLDDDVKSRRLSRRIQESMQPYLSTFISVSATLRFPPPYPIRKMKELDCQLIIARRSWEDEVIKNEEQVVRGHAEEPTVVPDGTTQDITLEDDISTQIEKLPVPELIDTPDTPFANMKNADGTSDISNASEYFDHKLVSSSSQSSLRSMTIPSLTSQLDTSLEEYRPKEVTDIATLSSWEQVKWRHNEQLRIWEWYLNNNRDDFMVSKYQCLNVLEYTVPVRDLGHRKSCFSPRLVFMKFYGDNDCTLGQFIDKAAHDTWTQFLNPAAVCQGKGCEQSLAVHCSVFLHNESRLIVNVDLWDPQIRARMNIRPKPDIKTTWSVCRVCGHTTPFIAMSEEMQRYSFAKFLELYFYPADVQTLQGAGCLHNVYQHHNRYFSVLGITVMFQSDPITLYEVCPPPLHIHVRSETLLRLKNIDYERLLRRNADWYSGLVDDLKLIRVEALTGDEEQDANFARDIDILINRAISERSEMARLVQEIYKESRPTDTIALNRFRAERQDRIVAWQQDFDKLPKPKIGEKESRRSAFGSVRAIWPKRYDLPGLLEGLHLPPSSVLEIDELPSLLRKAVGDVLPPAVTPDLSDAETPASHVNETASEASKVSTATSDGKEKEISESDEGSDSTIGASKGEAIQSHVQTDDPATQEGSSGKTQENAIVIPARSRLPRRSGYRPNVAELVKRYQEFLPAEVSQELATCAFPPPLPPVATESDTDGAQMAFPRRPKSKLRQREPQRKESVSDFERSYAMNVAPRPFAGQSNVTRKRGAAARIAGLPMSSAESRESSRRTSPDKRTAFPRQNTEAMLRAGRLSPTPGEVATLESTSRNKPRLSGRSTTKERVPPLRQPSSTNSKFLPRRTSATTGGTGGTLGGKVLNTARQFEKLSKDNGRRYAIIRGRRVRPVAPARVKLEVVDSIKEAIKDESYDSSSSSEADDEGDGDDEHDGTDLKDSPQEISLNSSVNIKQVPEGNQTESGTSTTDVPAVELTTTDNATSVTLVPGQTAQMGLAAPSSLPSPTGQLHTPSETPPSYDGDTAPSPAERHSTIMKALSGFWPQPATPLRNIPDFESDDLMADPEHIFRESSMVARTDEPTSVIALALNSPQYREMLQKSRAEKRLAKEPKLSEGGEAFMPDDMSISDSASTWGVVNVGSSDEANPRDDLRVPSSKLPWAISFESGGLAITCTILYPEQFDALRRTYDCDKVLVESLSRCKSWNASGGKSGSAFLKTKDERFIAKELSKTELESLTTFAPAYFDYMSSTTSADRPTMLAKIFGCFKIVLRKVGKGKDKSSRKFQMNLLVMENLFYGREVLSNIYDLKGATRRRRVQASGQPNEVLLDENLVEREHEDPLYLREHSKRILQSALSNDTKFLQDVFVMDYSLLVGVDSQTNELVMGIVDYVRPYTWDKKVENFVKETGFLNGAGEGGPAVMHPRAYRERFLSAMERYFPLVPDRWMKTRDLPQSRTEAI